MGEVVDGGAAGVHTGGAGDEGLKLLEAAGEGVVEVEGTHGAVWGFVLDFRGWTLGGT